MSAQVINFPQRGLAQPFFWSVEPTHVPKDKNLMRSGLPREFIYEELFGKPDPTDQELLLETFLLECD